MKLDAEAIMDGCVLDDLDRKSMTEIAEITHRCLIAYELNTKS